MEDLKARLAQRAERKVLQAKGISPSQLDGLPTEGKTSGEGSINLDETKGLRPEMTIPEIKAYGAALLPPVVVPDAIKLKAEIFAYVENAEKYQIESTENGTKPATAWGANN